MDRTIGTFKITECFLEKEFYAMKTFINMISKILDLKETDICHIHDFPGYFIAKDGRVLSCLNVKPRILRTAKVNSGYDINKLMRDGKRRPIYVHHLLLENFVGPRPEGYRAHFKDGDKDNLHVDNLEWRPSTSRAWAERYAPEGQGALPVGLIAEVVALAHKNDTNGLQRVLSRLRD